MITRFIRGESIPRVDTIMAIEDFVETSVWLVRETTAKPVELPKGTKTWMTGKISLRPRIWREKGPANMTLETYQPSSMPDTRWEAIRDFTVGLGQHYRDLGPEIAYNRYMPVLARLVNVVCNRDGYEQNVEVVLNADWTEVMIRDELDDLSVHSQGVYKTTLRKLREALNRR